MNDSESGAQLLARLGNRPTLQNLDPTLLPGGLQPKDVLELYGESGSGKTQSLLHWTAKCILPSSWNDLELNGLDAGVIFIDNDYHFNLIRLVGIMESTIIAHCEAQKKENPTEADLEELIKSSLSHLQLYHCSSSHQFAITLFSLESILGHQPETCVLMIDSISSFYWLDRHSGGDRYKEQEKNLTAACTAIDNLRTTYQISIISSTSPLVQKKGIAGEDYSDFLCKAWLRLVNRRILFSQKSQQNFMAKWISADKVASSRIFAIGEQGLIFTE
ncbi:hypothetical protein CAPTEDRAFT_151675 [Capitella teleta]|uniref:RecA family profile 1 domain-containing protein n=1 Tax=Capitella teleta TaxID=283909 RepID=R7T5F2_CAPTE|nr:hypothetical protein CAPTEDRAFT_151675 [Capitella teleta]|eukprot:ELT88440.1 hypothetical protein CAPTEDRAFT_151675 [Capitella teleta]